MTKRQRLPKWVAQLGQCAAVLALAASLAAAQTAAPKQQPAPPQANSAGKRITPDQAKQLFALVDELIGFSSGETGLPVKSAVKRQLTTRAAVEKFLNEKLADDQDAKRMQRDEIVLKKFGLLDRDFDLKPFLVALLKEQIEAYYDTKTKTVNLLDWVDADEQRPVLAHELTHALQDQHIDLEKWNEQSPEDVSTNAAGDADHLARDEMDSAREAVAEGQATAVMFDYVLKPLGKSLVKDPEVLDALQERMNGAADSPVMSRAPLLLSESLEFPYREGLSFEQDVWMDQGRDAAFAGTLDRPPSSTWEILNPREYERKHTAAVPLMPNIHPLVDPLYRPYDIGQVGQFDVRVLARLIGGDSSSRDLTPAWDGGLYWAGQLRSSTTPAEQNSTRSLALFYLSAWKSEDSARVFALLYARSLPRKYSGVALAGTQDSPVQPGAVEQIYTTSEGPVAIITSGKMVFVAESFPLPLARKLAALMINTQGTGDTRMVKAAQPYALPAQPAMRPLSADFTSFFANCGVMKAAVDAAIETAR